MAYTNTNDWFATADRRKPGEPMQAWAKRALYAELGGPVTVAEMASWGWFSEGP